MNNRYLTPVLFITFARPEYAREAFNAIKNAKPNLLYFYSNKARIGNLDEIKRNNEIRNYLNEIDWDCEVKVFFRDEYVDVYTSLFSAIDWVFDENEKAIILEEDCVASPAFFDYCNKSLNHYETEKKIWLISGDNFTPQFYKGKESIFFGRYGHIYGWATWKDRWIKIDRKLENWNNMNMHRNCNKYYTTNKESKFHYKRFKTYYEKDHNLHSIWDFLFCISIVINNGLYILPKFNLVRNIGKNGVHNNNNQDYYFHTLPLFDEDVYPIDKFPNSIKPDDFYDYNHFKNHWLKFEVSFSKRIIRKLNKIFRLLFSSN